MEVSIFPRSASSLTISVLRTNTVIENRYRFTVFGVYLNGSDLPAFTVRLRTPLFPGGTGYAKIITPEGKTENVTDPYSFFYLERAEADFLSKNN